jgi:LEA14-like dessication related protein
MKTLRWVLPLMLLIQSCALKAPEFRGSEGFKMEGREGNEIKFNAGVKVYNPNWFGVKLKKSKVEVYLEDQYMGILSLEKKAKMKANRESTIEFPLKMALEDGALITALKYSMKDEVNLIVKGKVKGGVWIISKKIEVNDTIKVPGKNLRGKF